MKTLKQGFEDGHTWFVTTTEDGHQVIIQAVGGMGYELWCDDTHVQTWPASRHGRLQLRLDLGNGIPLESGETLTLPDDHRWDAED